jgi:hypothetical protein
MRITPGLQLALIGSLCIGGFAAAVTPRQVPSCTGSPTDPPDPAHQCQTSSFCECKQAKVNMPSSTCDPTGGNCATTVDCSDGFEWGSVTPGQCVTGPELKGCADGGDVPKDVYCYQCTETHAGCTPSTLWRCKWGPTNQHQSVTVQECSGSG